MTILHHPTDHTLLSHGSGSLHPALSLVVAAHLERCATCRRAVAAWESLGGAYLDALPPAAMNSDALTLALGRLDTITPEKRPSRSAPASLVKDLTTTARPRRQLAPGIWLSPLLHDRATKHRVHILGVEAGGTIPYHGHDGVEMTCVLSGRFKDGDATYGPGDFLELDGSNQHMQTVEGAEACVCVIGSYGLPRLPGIRGWITRQFM